MNGTTVGLFDSLSVLHITERLVDRRQERERRTEEMGIAGGGGSVPSPLAGGKDEEYHPSLVADSPGVRMASFERPPSSPVRYRLVPGE